MANQEDLLTREAAFWNGDAAFYRDNLADSCLVALVEMAGVFSKEQVASTVTSGRRWRDVAIKAKGFLEPTPGVAILSYEAEAVRANGETYAALVSSCYVRLDGSWKLAFHQQTPLDRG